MGTVTQEVKSEGSGSQTVDHILGNCDAGNIVVHIFCHTPGFSIGGIFVEENIVAVKHVQHRQPDGGILQTDVGDIHEGGSGLSPGKFRDTNAPFIQHGNYLATGRECVFNTNT